MHFESYLIRLSAVSGEYLVAGVQLDITELRPGIGLITINGTGSRIAASILTAIGSGSTLNLSDAGQLTTPAFNLASGSTLDITLDDPDAITVSGQALLAGTLNGVRFSCVLSVFPHECAKKSLRALPCSKSARV